MAQLEGADGLSSEGKDAVLAIRADVARRITFASHQNDVAVILDLSVSNGTETVVEDLVLEVTADPPFLGGRRWRIDRIPAGGKISIQDRRTPLEGGFLHGLSEAMHGEVRLILWQGENILSQGRWPATALARNEWGGYSHMPELLAAFVTPNDPAVSRLLKDAAGILKSAGRRSAIDGYESKSRSRVWELASAIWAAVCARGISYALPPASFEREGQKVRLPSDIENQGLATCLDTTLFFAAALEQAGLKPIVAFTEGHALAGVWLQPQHLPAMTVEEAMEIRKAVALDELILFETTLATQDAPVPFARAIDNAQHRMAEENEGEFIYAIDIAHARSRGVQPLSFRADQPAQREVADGAHSSAPPTLDTPPPLPGFDTDAVDMDKNEEASPAERLERWKRSLLDLSKRNRLLNLKESRTAIPIFCPNPAEMEDRIADGKRMKLISPPARRGIDAEIDAMLRKLRTGDDLDVKFANDALGRNELVANTDEKSLEKGAIELFRKARSDMKEGGANTLFLAIGMLRWRPTGEKVRSYRAPLILLPVKLERKSARSQPYLTSHDDDPVFNLTLIEMLRQDFEIGLPELTGELPTDQSGIDVSRIWEIVRTRVREAPGFEVVEEVVLSTFSFAKYLMWKDLADRTDGLKRSPFVKHMIDSPREPYEGGAAFMEPREIDHRIDPKDLLAPLNADGSQIVGIHASTVGGDFVLEGPPGTGKSETIGNIIAHNLGMGRRVLFVSEKMAALEVVYDRLRKAGLGDFCLELHSAKANKKAVIGQLGAAWDERSKNSKSEWDAIADRLAKVRSDLNGLVAALHAPGPAGVSPRAAIGRLLRFGEEHRLDLEWPNSLSAGHAPTPEAYESLKEAARKLQLEFSRLEPADFETFDGIDQDDWSNAWQTEVVKSARDLGRAIGGLVTARDNLVAKLGLPPAGQSVDEARLFAALAHLAEEGSLRDCSVGLSPDGKRAIEAIQAGTAELETYQKLKSGLSAAYPDDRIEATTIDQFIAAHDAGEQKFWPFSALTRRALRNRIRVCFGISKRESRAPEDDLLRLRDMAMARQAMEEHTADLPANTPWRGLVTDSAEVGKALMIADKLRTAAIQLSEFGRDLSETRSALARCFGEGRDMLEDGMPLRKACDDLLAAESSFSSAFEHFAGEAAYDEPDLDLSRIAAVVDGVVSREKRLNFWCAWVEARREADSLGLQALTTALQIGAIAQDRTVDSFETAYARWVAPLLIDEREELKRFSSVRHEDLIKSFRELDEELSRLAADQIRARLSGEVPSKSDAKGVAGYGVLARELQKKMRHKPVRELVGEMGDTLTTLTPCLMMSPLSVAQYLPADQMQFDLVVFDEASQITVPDAIGAIARGRNCIIVGDPKQMPPTRFFERGASDEDDDDLRDLESILDEALAARTPLHRLTGHYRSRHESLITFSNHAYYGGELVTYPAADTRDSVVSLRKVEGVYAKGKARTNQVEARAVVAEVVNRLRDPRQSDLSIGVVTLNSEQQRLVEDLLDQERRQDPDLEPFFGDDAKEPVFVKNLETVQGDQRDVILLSIGYGPTEPGGRSMSMNFGPLNRDGGERRLNVAITRATSEVVIFASFDSGMIDLQRTSAAAVRDLKHYMDFAERGPVALSEAIHADGGMHAYDSDFEEAIATGLRQRGWNVLTQIGVSRFRVDLGIVHPDTPGKFLAGVECDGATYHASPSARDRDRVRQIILERLGWRLIRVWSTDFFNDPTSSLHRVHSALVELLETDRAEAIREGAINSSGASEDTSANEAEEHATYGGLPPDDVEAQRTESGLSEEPAELEPEARRVGGTMATPPDADADGKPRPAANPNRFYDPDYRSVVGRMAAARIDAEGPITFKRLAQLIAREHGFQRTGKEISGVVWRAIINRRIYEQTTDDHKVFWPKDVEPKQLIRFRGLSFAGFERTWPEVPRPEKRGLVAELLANAPDDIATAVANRIDYSRITAGFRREIDELASEVSEEH